MRGPVAGQAALAGTAWQVDYANSTLTFLVSIGGVSTSGEFSDWHATIHYDPVTPDTADVTVGINMGSVAIVSPQAAPLLTTGPWLDITGHPSARFIGKGFVVNNDQSLQLPGQLSLKGVDMPTTMTGTIDVDEATAHAQFEASLSRSVFEIGDDTPAVSNSVTVFADLKATRLANQPSERDLS